MPDDKMIRSTWVMSAMTMVSRLLGLLRDKMLVVVFGASSGVLDAFLLAFTIPNLFRRLFGEGALTAAFLPVYIDYRENRGIDEAEQFASTVVTSLVAFLSGVVAAGMLACGAAWLVWPDAGSALPLKLTTLMLPFAVFICVAALLSAMLQSLRRFAVPAAMPILLNLAILGVLAYLHWGAPGGVAANDIVYIALAVVGVGVVQVVLLYAALPRDASLAPKLDRAHPGVSRVLAAMGPTALGLAAFQINVLLDRLIAYALVAEDGALTHLYLGNRLLQLPLGLFGVALATAAFPELVSHFGRKEWEPLFARLRTAVRFLMFVLLPATAGLIALAEPTIRMIFFEPEGTGFTDAAVYRTSAVLVLYAPGLFFIATQQLLTRLFYAQDDYRTPVRICLVMVGVNLLLNLALIHAPDLWALHVHGTTAPLGEAGLALSTSICAAVSAFWMWRVMRRRLVAASSEKVLQKGLDGLGAAAGRIGIAAVATGVFAWLCAQSMPAEPELWVRIERGLVSLLLGVAGYVVLCYVVPLPEFDEFVRGRRHDDDDDPPTAESPSSAS